MTDEENKGMDWWNDSDSGKMKNSEKKTGSSATSLITNLMCTGLGSKSILGIQRPATNNSSHGIAFVYVCVCGRRQVWVEGESVGWDASHSTQHIF